MDTVTTATSALVDAIHAMPVVPAVTLASKLLLDTIAAIPAKPGDDGEQAYIAAIELDDVASRLYKSGAVACMTREKRGLIKAMRDAVARLKNEIFLLIGLPPDSV